MADLENSKRSIERATYAPIHAPRQVEQPVGRALDKWSYFAALKTTVSEFNLVSRAMTGKKKPTPKADHKYLSILRAAISDQPDTPDASLPLRMLREFAPMPSSFLKRFGAALLNVREAQVKNTLASHASLLTQYEKAISKTTTAAANTTPTLSSDYKLDDKFVLAGVPGAKAYRSETAATVIPPAKRTKSSGRKAPAADATGMTAAASAILTLPPREPAVPSTPDNTPLTVGTLLDWAIEQNLDKNAVQATQAMLASANASRDITLAQYKTISNSNVALTQGLNYAFDQRVQMEPIGMLHLERLSFIPAGIERGELLYSVPLSPGEHVNISHKEWSNTSQEFEQIVTDSLEAYSEEGVTEKSELVQSTNSQREHTSGYDLGVTASGGWGPVSISASASYHVSDSATSSQTTARNQSNELTRKASSRVKKEHKQSFKVASASGTEDQAVRLITNPFPDKATRVDYYQLVRKWRVDLYRYGLRMTYDLAIPEPGSDILSKIVEIKSITAALSEGFGGTTSTLPWARFDLTPQQITRGNYLGLAAQYSVPVEPPPVDQIVITRTFTKNWPNKDSANDSDYTTFEMDVPDGYQVTGWSNQWNWWAWTDESYHFEIHPDLNAWLGVSGHLTLSVGTKYVSAFSIQLKLWFGLSQAAYEAWKQRVWGTLREAAQARYEMNRTMLQDRLARLQEEVGAQDPLSLRKIEREEVMKHVLRWLFGPSFTFVPPGVPPDLYGANGSVINDQVWAQVLAQGEVIKFLHQAVEWENMMFLLYPYFWSHTSRWEFKKYLDHPDFLHRIFLKAGSARVVLTIRPSFERDFVSFLETGTLDGLPQTHPYMTIATEMQAFANTNYPGIRAANPIENARPLLTPLQQKTWDEMQGIIVLLNQYKSNNGAYPTTAQGLAVLAPLGTVPAADPWGNPYQYRSPGAYTDFELGSLGADGAVGGEDDNSDIQSWVEASLIGRWYEYTPTSATDISFNEKLPSS
jgi:Type II secretion system (T2SS), protein G